MSKGPPYPPPEPTSRQRQPPPLMTLFERGPVTDLDRPGGHPVLDNPSRFAYVAPDGSIANGGRSLPPIQLPPQVSHRVQPPHPPRKSPHVISVASLLSNTPEPSSGTSIAPPTSHNHDSTIADDAVTRPSPYQSPASIDDISPKDTRHPQSIHAPIFPHALDQPPRLHNDSGQPFAFSKTRRPTSRCTSSGSDADLRRTNPTDPTTVSPSYGSDSKAPSPRDRSQSYPPAPPRTITPPFKYTLRVRQQPSAARACGYGERDRRVVDPPPILELQITDVATGAPQQDPNAMLALHCTLLKDQGAEDATEIRSSAASTSAPPQQQQQSDVQYSRRLMGTLVASPYQAKDENGQAGTFFVFPDLSCRNPGQFRLKFKLLRIDPQNMTQGAVHASVGTVTSEVFSVYTAKDFPGMRASSALLKALCRQGLNVGVKKGSEARKSKSRNKKEASSSGSSDDDDDEDSDGAAHDVLDYRRSGGGGGGGGISNSVIGVTRPGSPKVRSRKRAKSRKLGKGRREF